MGDARKPLSSDESKEAPRNFGELPSEHCDDIYDDGVEEKKPEDKPSDYYVAGTESWPKGSGHNLARVENLEDVEEKTPECRLSSPAEENRPLGSFSRVNSNAWLKANANVISGGLCRFFYRKYEDPNFQFFHSISALLSDNPEKLEYSAKYFREQGLMLMQQALNLSPGSGKEQMFFVGCLFAAVNGWMLRSCVPIASHMFQANSEARQVLASVIKMDVYKEDLKKFDEALTPALKQCGLFPENNNIPSQVVKSYLVKEDQDEEIEDVVIKGSRESSIPHPRLKYYTGV